MSLWNCDYPTEGILIPTPDLIDINRQDYISLEEIEEEEYHRYKYNRMELYPSALTNNLVSETDSVFTFILKGEEVKLKKEVNFKYDDNRANESWNECIGFLLNQQLQIVRACSVSGDLHVFADIYLIDSISGYRYVLPNYMDYLSTEPQFSPNKKHIAYVQDDFYDEKGYIILMKFIKEAKPAERIVALAIKYPDMTDELIWIENDSFILKAYTRMESINVYKYFIVKINENNTFFDIK